ncbi:MAG: hypothetical protein IT311_09235 [Anaerolineales bacterium]|nr:hypothetical protein [Anaerolineales bacterium]MCZ2122514.1 hypothetical protein [Anaerolineales bacterium]
MKTVQIPVSLREALGEKSSVPELIMIFLTSILGTLGLFYFTNTEWNELSFWKIIILFLLIFDVLAGFIANLTLSTNNYYKGNPKLRLVFIAIHIQPLIFSFLLSENLALCFGVWIYTVIAALIVNALQKFPAQKVLAASLATFGLLGLFLNSTNLSILLFTSLAFYHLKVVYSFAVDQYASREI